MQHLMSYAALIILFMSSACAGVGLPYTDYRLGRTLIESSRQETNSTCIDLQVLNQAANELEAKHLNYLRTKDEQQAIKATELMVSLGKQCEVRFVKLSIPQIKTELFGDIQTIADSSKLRELGGLLFEYQNVSTRSGIELSLHLNQFTKGPKRRLVAIYRLENDLVIHYNYSGTNNVDRKSRTWPVQEFFGVIIKTGIQIAIP